LSENEELMLAAAYLSRLAEPNCFPLWSFVQDVGYIQAAKEIHMNEAPQEVLGWVNRGHVSTGSPAAEAMLEVAADNDIRLITPADDEWPSAALQSLRDIAGYSWRWLPNGSPVSAADDLVPPLALWLKGEARLNAATLVPAAAIVGARAATAYGEHVATDMAYGLALKSVTVVSGGAYGIDAAAHRGADRLNGTGVQVLVSAGGLDRPYPSGNRTLFERVAETGVLVSERPPGSAPHRTRFLARNRLVASFGRAVVVVEAARRSGSMDTAAKARELMRPVLAVPGPVTSAMSTGCHALLTDEEHPARLVTSAADVMKHLDELALQPQW
jgi:DNA processing protein